MYVHTLTGGALHMCTRMCCWIHACGTIVHVCVLISSTCVELWVTRWHFVVCICGAGCNNTRIAWCIDYRCAFIHITTEHAMYVACLLPVLLACRLSVSILQCRQVREHIRSPKAWIVDTRTNKSHAIQCRSRKMSHRYVSTIAH